jgi:hypothetical protein
MHKLSKIAPLPDWSRRFAVPIPVQNRKPLATLRDAASNITSLPKAERRPHWRTATELLIIIAEHGGDPMMARIAIMRALHRHKP